MGADTSIFPKMFKMLDLVSDLGKVQINVVTRMFQYTVGKNIIWNNCIERNKNVRQQEALQIICKGGKCAF